MNRLTKNVTHVITSVSLPRMPNFINSAAQELAGNIMKCTPRVFFKIYMRQVRDGRELAADNAVVHVEERVRSDFAEQRNKQLRQRPRHPVLRLFHLLLLLSGLCS